MVTGSELLGAAQGLKFAFDALQRLNSAAKAAAINEVKIALTQHIIEAQQALTAAGIAQANAAETIRDLEQQIADMEDWKGEKERYQLKAVDTGAFAYMHKPGMENGEPAMWLCQTCFEKRHKSPLQFREQLKSHSGGRGLHSSWACNQCKTGIVVHYNRNPAKPWPTDEGDPPEPPRPTPPQIPSTETAWTREPRGR